MLAKTTLHDPLLYILLDLVNLANHCLSQLHKCYYQKKAFLQLLRLTNIEEKRKSQGALVHLLITFLQLPFSLCLTYSILWLSDLQSSASGKFSSCLFCFPPVSFYVHLSPPAVKRESSWLSSPVLLFFIMLPASQLTSESQFFRQNCCGSLSISFSALF